MLQKLVIRNYAIIDRLTIEPHKQLNIVTGETGAGKSIIIGALSLVLGERADTSVLINKEEKCVVEGHFDVKGNEAFRLALSAAELDEDDQCIIRREIAANGKSRAFVNDTPVTLSVLNRLASLLIDLHQQFGHLALQDDEFQINVVDALAGSLEDRRGYSESYRQYRSLAAQVAEHERLQAQWQKESDYKQFLYDELLQAGFKEDEIEDADRQLKQLSHAERILQVLQSGRAVLEEGEQPLTNELKKISQQLQQISAVLPEAEQLQQRLSSVHAELKDIAYELESLEGKLNMDPSLMAALQERIDLGYRLFKKHGISSTQALLDIQAQLSGELEATHNMSDTLEKLRKEAAVHRKQLVEAGAALSKKRKQQAPVIAEQVNELLRLVGMPNARFNIQLTGLDEPAQMGMDEVSFLLDANKSGQLLPVYKAASGGEMSRIMLCIKSLTAKALQLPTLIFDEVDTGISGEAARQVGLLLQDLAMHHQVVCITHQPQVAARGQRHFFVYKELDAQDRIKTQVRILEPQDRVFAIAQMIGGETPGDAALQHARELVTE